MPGREKEIPTVAEWDISTGMDKAKEIVAEEEMVTSTGTVAGIKMHLPLNPKNPTTRISKHAFKEEAKLFLIFGSILASFLFSKCTKNDRTTTDRRANHSKQGCN